MKKKFTLLVAIAIAIVFAKATTPIGTLETDKATLLQLYDSLSGSAWLKTVDGVDVPFNWSKDADIQDFAGVTIGSIEGVDRVTELALGGITNLEGKIPAIIGKLDGLQSINLENNLYLTGAIPDEFYDMISLKYIRIANTSISGKISNKIGQLTDLRSIFMDKNSFMEGGIPDGIGLCTKLDYIRVADCPRMTGVISPEIGKCTALTVLQCERSGFTGALPDGIATLPNLKYLNANYNFFTSCPNFAAEGARFPSVMAELHQNLIPFGYLLPMKGYTRSLTAKGDTWYYRFIDQKPGLILTTDTLKVKIGASLVLDIDELLPNNGGDNFKWYYNNALISSEKKLTLTMSNGTIGDYYCEISTDPDILYSGVCPVCGWQDADNTINPRPEAMAINTTQTLKVLVNDGTGVKDNFADKNITIINNPQHGSFNLIIGDDKLIGEPYRVIDLNGKVIKSGTIDVMFQEVSIANVPNGIYMFQFYSNNNYAGKKVIIK